MFAFSLVSCKSSKSTSTATASSSNSTIQETVAGMLGVGAPSSSAAQQAGKNAGSSILNLYNAYKAEGKLDMSNVNNLLNCATLATSVMQIKDNYKDKTFYKDFATGMVSSATSLITSANVDNTISSLLNTDLSGLTSLANTVSSTASSVSNTANTVANNANTTSAISALTSLLGGLAQ